MGIVSPIVPSKSKATNLIITLHLMIFRITRQGFPTAKLFAGISLVTTLPAPITLFCPIVTPGKIITPPPIQQPSSIMTEKAKVRRTYLQPSGVSVHTSRSLNSTG